MILGNRKNGNSKPFYVFKICLLGQARVGKTCLAQRLCFDKFDANTKLTIGLDFYSYNFPVLINKEESIIKLSIWDFGAQERFRQLFPHYVIGLDGMLMIFDLSDPESLYNLEWWYQKLITYQQVDNPKLLIGTKYDLVQEKSDKNSDFFLEINDTLEEYKIEMYINTSAKENINILFSFKEIVSAIIKKHNLPFDGFL